MRYAVVWLVAGGVAALLVVVFLRQTGGEPAPRPAADPLEQVTASGCVLQQPRGREAELSRPPVGGPAGRPLADGVYTAPQPRKRLVGALRRGAIVIQYDRRLPAHELALILQAFSTPVAARIVVPDASRMTFKVAATAWGRVIGCSRLDPRVVAALGRFAQRYAGRGPGG